jgi:tetratricopeptide (TPR) repeat protein
VRLDIILVLLLLALSFLVGSFAATNSDVWLQLASGRQIAQGDWTVGVDAFSFATEGTATRPAVPWVQHSWLYSWLMYLLYNLLGGGGLVILKALAVALLAWFLLQIPGGKSNRFLSVIYVGMTVLAISPQLILRPMTLSFLLFVMTLFICYRAGALGNVPPKTRVLWLLPVLFLVWANLDVWFIMGPLTVLLLLAGNGLGLLLGLPRSFPSKTLAAVLVVSLLACLVNPHHVRVFMLPPELANLLVRVAPLPDFLGAGGRALRNLQLADPDTYALLSPLSSRYLGSHPPTGGQSIGALAYFPLLVLGLLSFVVNSAVTKKPGAPGLHPGRFMLWAMLGFLSLLQARLIPWFAIASAPITLLNVVDWRTWLNNIHVPNWRPALLGRALTAFLFVILLFLAWPGWLYASPGDFSSPRRVAWAMPADPSYHNTALFLGDANKGDRRGRDLVGSGPRGNGQGLRVFNFSPEIAHYCAWFAPSVKCFLDSRWSLFPDDAALAVKTRMALSVNEPETWRPVLLDRKVDYLVVSNFPNKREADLAAQLWRDDAHWLQKYADGKTLVFIWSGPAKTFGGEFAAELMERAYGTVPESQRAPTRGPTLPQEEPSFWAQYWQAARPLPLTYYESNMWLRYHQVMVILQNPTQNPFSWHRTYSIASQVARGAEPAGLGSFSITLPYALDTVLTIPAKLYTFRWRSNNKLILKSRDLGQPAALLLMTRCLRRALAENPDHARAYLLLTDDYRTLLNDAEEHWANYRGDPKLAKGLRSTIRQVQIITALMTFLDLRPEDPQIHEQVASILLQQNFLDAALEHFRQALQHFDQYLPDLRNTKEVEALKNKKAALEKGVQALEEDVKKRTEQYALEAASRKGLERFPLAMNRGLALEAVKQLRDVKMEGLNPQEKLARDFVLSQLMVTMGRANYLTEGLEKTGPTLWPVRVCYAAALGNYAEMDQVLGDMEKAEIGKRARGVAVAAVLLNGLHGCPTDQLPWFSHALGSLKLLQLSMDEFARPSAEYLALRGIMALEYGDTAAAQKYLRTALELAGANAYFQDRPIAERYLDLLHNANR